MPTKILTVDDSKTIRLIIAKAFKPYDCTILEGVNGVEGLAVAAKEKPDLIILDITMPVMDGYETLTKLKNEPDLKHIPIIMLTAEAGKENIIRIAKLGVRDYLVKPFKEEALIEKAGKIVKLAPRHQKAASTKNYDDPLEFLVVDDKPAIIEQIRQALSQTPWKFNGASDVKTALDCCAQCPPDALLISLSLPDGAAFRLFQWIASNPQTQSVPVIGVCVKTSTTEQEQAEKAGFAAIVTKPINPEDLHDKLVQTLQLNTAKRFFQERDGILTFTSPVELTSTAAEDILRFIPEKISEFVDGGMDKVILHFGKTRGVDWKLVKICIKALGMCKELGLRHCVVGSDEFGKECENHPETEKLHFVYNWNDAVASFKRKEEDAEAA